MTSGATSIAHSSARAQGAEQEGLLQPITNIAVYSTKFALFGTALFGVSLYQSKQFKYVRRNGKQPGKHVTLRYVAEFAIYALSPPYLYFSLSPYSPS